jgi:S-methylmethionine-dependent homocysteine/selenocysteine methylase
LREKAIEEERQKLNEMATKLTRQNHDEITQQGPTALERVCSALPPVADALTRIATAYFKQKQHPQNNKHQNFYSKTDLFRQSSDDSSSEGEEEPFRISINPRSFRTSSGEFQMHSDSD